MVQLQVAPSSDSPANDTERYARLGKAIGKALATGGKKESARIVATGLDRFNAAAEAMLDIRRPRNKGIWRQPFRNAMNTFLSAPSRSQAVESGQFLPDGPNALYNEVTDQEVAIIWLVKASLRVAAGKKGNLNLALENAQLAARAQQLVIDRLTGDNKMDWPTFKELLPPAGMEWETPMWNTEMWRAGWVIGTGSPALFHNLLYAPFLTARQKPFLRSSTNLYVCTQAVAELLSNIA
jgi:hypothetical protein